MFEIEWDPAKAASNRRKHRVSFELAATVFRGPLARSIPDDDRDAFEERWITIGQARGARLLVVSPHRCPERRRQDVRPEYLGSARHP